MPDSIILLAGGTGDLGGRIARALVHCGAAVRALVRPGAAPDKIDRLRKLGVAIAEADFADPAALDRACAGVACVVSALNGLRDVVVDQQSRLLEAAVRSGAARFIPSDFAADFTRLPAGSNRNFDLRREFKARLDAAPIAATSILNGAFADMLAGQAPLIWKRFRRVLYVHSADQKMDFTTKDDVAAFTARAALDTTTPRLLRIAGSEVSARDLAAIMTELTARPYKPLRAMSLQGLERLIKFTRFVYPAKTAVFPPWQGMQYMHNLFSGQAKLAPLDNGRYPDLTWTPVREVLSKI